MRKEILLITRPITSPWDEASKNFAFMLAKHISQFTFHLLTCKSKKLHDINCNVIQEPIYTSSQIDKIQKLILLKNLIQDFKSVQIYHSLFTPSFWTSRILKLIVKKYNKKSIQTAACFNIHSFRLKELFFADLIITHSNYSKNILNKTGILNVKTIYPGVDLDKFNPRVNIDYLKCHLGLSNENVILYPGEYARLGAVQVITKSIPEIKKIIPNIKFIFACRIKTVRDQRIEQKTKNLLKEKNLLDSVVFLNTVEDMPALINLSTLCIFPVEEMTGKFDLPMVLLECLACGKPIVITDIEPLNEIIKDEVGIKIKPGNYDELTQAIVKIIKDQELRKKMSYKCLKVADEFFNIKKTAQNYSKVYEEI